MTASNPHAQWHKTIDTLPLHAFISVVVDGHLQPLIISGLPTDQELANTWQEIKTEYSDAMGDSETEMHLQLLKDVTCLEIKMTLLDTALDVLGKFPYEPMLKELNELLGTAYAFPAFNSPEYIAMLKNARNRGKSFKIDRDMKKMELEAYGNKKSEDDAPVVEHSRKYFHQVLITLSDHAKYPITDLITTFEFCERVKRWTEHVEHLKNLPNG
ncbi:MAG TPA: hypothetical protein VK666_07865 [Chryseolinea sp.]|nr:hypothetical protein [Chryseolinea sp.]